MAATKRAMRPQDVSRRVREIASMVTPSNRIDDAGMRTAEDNLYESVLRAIAKCRSIGTARDLALEALETKKLAFARWAS